MWQIGTFLAFGTRLTDFAESKTLAGRAFNRRVLFKMHRCTHGQRIDLQASLSVRPLCLRRAVERGFKHSERLRNKHGQFSSI